MTKVPLPAEDPSARVEAEFRRIAAIMGGLPICNPALAVEALGFRPWNGLWVGALLTPWTLNLVLLPGGNGDFRRLKQDETQVWSFPSGDYGFWGGPPSALGDYQTCPLISPVLEFADQQSLREAAAAALEGLMAAQEPVPDPPAGDSGRSRRAFLFGRGAAA
ncbi:MAG: [NiFe]-hydrogenase assembly chaperone HybE [Rhodocyclaceae bacterium]|nr:[NiFe]-hydrogenase assembly chaperone HybE [Rhodocyclaceae bacterium]